MIKTISNIFKKIKDKSDEKMVNEIIKRNERPITITIPDYLDNNGYGVCSCCKNKKEILYWQYLYDKDKKIRFGFCENCGKFISPILDKLRFLEDKIKGI